MHRRVLVFGRLACYVTGMGHVYQRVKLAAVNEEDLNILVDTGATLSLIPPALADRLDCLQQKLGRFRLFVEQDQRLPRRFEFIQFRECALVSGHEHYRIQARRQGDLLINCFC